LALRADVRAKPFFENGEQGREGTNYVWRRHPVPIVEKNLHNLPVKAGASERVEGHAASITNIETIRRQPNVSAFT
jgi:hypothetical protein